MSLLPRILTALALIGLLTTAAPPTWTEAQAQSKAAKDLKCKGCVGKKDIGKKAVKLKHLDKKLQNKIQENMMGANRHAFHEVINANATRTILTIGTFSLLAQCILNNGSGDRQVNFFLRSTVANWLLSGFTGLQPANQNIFLLSFFASIVALNVYQSQLFDGAISPAGVLLGLMYLSVAFNYQGNACTVSGYVDGVE